MFKDREEALRKMEQELMEEESLTEEVFEDEDDPWGEDFPDIYNTDSFDEDLEDYSHRVQEEPEKGILGLALLAIGLMAGVLALAVYWYFKLVG